MKWLTLPNGQMLNTKFIECINVEPIFDTDKWTIAIKLNSNDTPYLVDIYESVEEAQQELKILLPKLDEHEWHIGTDKPEPNRYIIIKDNGDDIPYLAYATDDGVIKETVNEEEIDESWIAKWKYVEVD